MCGFTCICRYTYTCVHMDMEGQDCQWKYSSITLSYSLRHISQLNSELTDTASLPNHFALGVLSLHSKLELQAGHHGHLSNGFCNLDSIPHTCMTSALTTEPPCSPWFHSLVSSSAITALPGNRKAEFSLGILDARWYQVPSGKG